MGLRNTQDSKSRNPFTVPNTKPIKLSNMLGRVLENLGRGWLIPAESMLHPLGSLLIMQVYSS